MQFSLPEFSSSRRYKPFHSCFLTKTNADQWVKEEQQNIHVKGVENDSSLHIGFGIVQYDVTKTKLLVWCKILPEKDKCIDIFRDY